MSTVPLKVTRPPPTGADAANRQSGKPLFRGAGDADYVCGCCGTVLAAGMGPGQRVIVDTTTCSGCGAENEFPVELRG
jgi:hypothetical protein